MTTKSKTQASTDRPAQAKDLVKAYEPTATGRRALEAHHLRLALRSIRQEPLVIVRLSLAA